MDSSNQGMSGTYMQYHNGNNFDSSQFYNDMQNFTNGSNDAQPQYDPALFDIPDISSFSPQGQQQQSQQQQPQPQATQPNYAQATQQRQSQSPAVQQFKPSQQSPYNNQQYGHNVYEQRAMPQSSFDPHVMARPSASPGPYDRYNFQHSIGFGGQPFDPRFVHYQPQQQSSTPTQSFSQQQPQVSHQYMNIAARPPSQPNPYQINPELFAQRPESHQSQQLHGLPYGFSQNQPASHRFIDPSMLNANGVIQGQTSEIQSRQVQPSPYFSKTGSTIDPRSLQHQIQLSNQTQAHPNVAQPNTSVVPGAVHGQYMQIQLGPVEQQKTANDPQAPKKPKTKAKKDGNASSDDDLEITNEPEPRPPVLAAPKPSDQRGKLIYEIVEAVWSDRNNNAPPEKIRSGIASFGDIVRGLRDGWKAQNEALKKAEIPNSPSAANAAALKTDVGRYREMMQAVTTNAVNSGHPSILKRLGDNQFTMSAMYSFLLDRVNADDYNSDLVKIILMLAMRFETLDEEQLEKVKWTKILTRFSKKSTNQSKEFAQKVLSNAKAASAKKKADKVHEGPLSPSADGKAGSSMAGVKRAREGDGAGLPVTKKAIVKPASKPLSVQIAERRKLQEKENSAKARAEKPTTNGTQPTAATKTKVAAPVKIGPFASLGSASKKPGTTNAERAAATAKERVDSIKPASPTSTAATIRRDVSKIDSPPQSKVPVAAGSASSFLGFLADMDKPKEAQTKKVEDLPNESPEQKEKRLRKESRRRLRVSWKPDSELVETKVFEHDPDEETGHEDSMMRDAGDTVREGEMLKRHFDKDEMDDDDEEVVDFEDTYSTPSEVDFDVIEAESRNGNFIKGGGPLKPESPSSQAQTEHEEGNLMTMYTPADQPETPKEVSALDDDDDFDPVVDFGEPEEKVRKREQSILSRKQNYETPQSQPSNGVDLSAMLRNLQQQQQQQPASNTQPPFDLQRTLGMFNQNQGTAPAQQSVLAGLDLQKLLAVSQQFTTMQQGQPSQQYQPPQQHQAAPSAAAAAPNLQAILAQMQGNQQNQALLVGNGSNPNPFPGADDQSKKGDGHKKRGKAPVGPDGKPLNYKTQVCSFWQEGKCLKGDACTYRHDE